MNNPVRGEVEAALGSLQLLLGDSDARFAAAEAVFHTHDPAALPALNKAIAKETDPAVKQHMEQARAAALLYSTDATDADRLAAIATIRARGDLDSRALLDGLTDQPPAVGTAAHRDHRDRPGVATLVGRTECLLWAQPGVRAAACRRRSRHHLRRDGRDQHGARRNGDDRRLRHLRCAANHS
jgi:hypothetical protein